MDLLETLNNIVIEGKNCRKETRKLKAILYESISRDCDLFLKQLNKVETHTHKMEALLNVVVSNKKLKKAT